MSQKETKTKTKTKINSHEMITKKIGKKVTNIIKKVEQNCK